MSDGDALQSAVASDPDENTSLLALADWCAEDGRDDMEFACRWCVQNNKRPQPPGPHEWWQWLFDGRGDYAYKNQRWILPSCLDHPPMNQGRWCHTRYGSLFEAMEDLGKGLRHLLDLVDLNSRQSRLT